MIPVKLSEICRVLSYDLQGEDVTVTGVSTDSRSVSASDVFVPIVGEKFDAHEFIPTIKECAATLCERECATVPFVKIPVSSTVEALGLIARENFYRADVPLTVSLTGSVGKTTTKEMCALVLSKKYNTFKTEGNRNNHIGLPLTLLSLDKSVEAFVCEMGMNHFGELSYLAGLFKSDIAMITNIGNAHIENLGSREGILKAKLEILEGLKEDGTLIINGDEPLFDGLDIPQKILRVGFGDKCDLYAENVVSHSDGVNFDCATPAGRVSVTLPVPGKHNVMNALFAMALAFLNLIPLEDAASALGEYVPSGMRQRIYKKSGCTVIADCYNAGIESMKASLEAMCDMRGESLCVAVLGDMLELGDMSELFHREVGKRASELKIDVLIAFGDKARFIAEEADGVERYFYSDRTEFEKKIMEYIPREPVILFKASRGMALEKTIASVGLSQE